MAKGVVKTHWRHSLEGPVGPVVQTGPAMEERTDLWRIHFLPEEGDKTTVVPNFQMMEVVITSICVVQLRRDHGKMELPQC